MTGETNLRKLLASMRPVLLPQTFAFATVPDQFTPDENVRPVMTFREAEGQTLTLESEAAERLGLQFVFPCRMITLQIHSSLEAVGFLAAITAKLAASGIGVNPFSAFYHDHLFVSIGRASKALSLLHERVAENAG